MGEHIIAALIGISFLIIVNIVAVAYSYGSLKSKVQSNCHRLTRIEDKLNGKVSK